MKTIKTERTLLRSWRESDAEDLFSYASGESVGPMAGWKPHESIEESREIIKAFMEADECWAIELKENRHVIGSVGLHKTKKAQLQYDYELGYVLSEEYWGRGLIPEAARAALAFGFNKLGAKRIIVSCFTFNARSRRVIEKLGGRYVCTILHSWMRYDGEVLDEDVYELKATPNYKFSSR